ncbi:MAG: hypothetical protein CMH56_08185 [Myxococcales bacterium]|nr:hypothetical protein [Myxococcales bacterium]|tara:strand:- start:167 stop:1765 length:1599 start_codon:yes stop_codon:yes gene_type:complete
MMNKNSWKYKLPLLMCGVFLWATPLSAMERETNCKDGIDNDGDTVYDCSDADCFAEAHCQPGQGEENSDATCGDWVDNDGDGVKDCEDMDCKAPGITTCYGSWDMRKAKVEQIKPETTKTVSQVLPDLKPGMGIEDLIGSGKDKDGERNDVLCSDGFDNDGDGMVDCADYGCRFDPDVTICQGSPDFRFSVVGNISQEYIQRGEIDNSGAPVDAVAENNWDTRFSRLQLRALGPIPQIQDSFFLLSTRMEKTPRLTWAMFQLPVGGGHYININSGGGGLSNALVLSTAKQLLLDPPYYVYSAFEQGNGAAMELGGPMPFLNPGLMRYRVFFGGGSGRFAGNVGGRYFTYDNTNYTYSVGAQVGINIIGYVSRWDSPFLYTPAPTALGLQVGVKYDQRAQERYPALNAASSFRWNRLILMGEFYGKQELEFESTQMAYNLQAGFLIWPKHLLLAADFGQYLPTEMQNPPEQLETDIRKNLQGQTQWRAALHWFFWRNIGVASVVYSDKLTAPYEEGDNFEYERIVEMVAQYRF